LYLLYFSFHKEANVTNRFLSPQHLLSGFHLLLGSAEALSPDVPLISDFLARFLTRAISDGLFSPLSLALELKLFTHQEASPSRDMAMRILSLVETLTRGETECASWGADDGRPVDEMKGLIDAALAEFLLHGDEKGTLQTLGGVEADFQHEVLKRLVYKGLDRSLRVRRDLWSLIGKMHGAGSMSNGQIAMGFRHLGEVREDMTLDCPRAEEILLETMVWAREEGLWGDQEMAGLMV
jgi:hypothetical protein